MKKLIILLLIPLSLTAYSQKKNRFSDYFPPKPPVANTVSDCEADSIFYDKVQEIYLSAANQESGILDPQKLTITIDVNDFLTLYYLGYLEGTLNYRAKGKEDFRELLIDLIEMRQAFKQRYNFQHGKYNWPE